MAYTDVDAVKEYRGLEDTDKDHLIASAISRAQARIETYCRTKFEAAADTTREFSYDDDQRIFGGSIGGSYGSSYISLYPGRYGRQSTRVWFDENLAQITSMVVDGEAIAEADYHLVPRNDRPAYALDLDGIYTSFSYNSTVSITGRWAYSVTPPEDIAFATIRLASYYHEVRKAPYSDTVGSDDFGGERTMPRSEPMDVKFLIQPYRFSPLLHDDQ